MTLLRSPARPEKSHRRGRWLPRQTGKEAKARCRLRTRSDPRTKLARSDGVCRSTLRNEEKLPESGRHMRPASPPLAELLNYTELKIFKPERKELLRSTEKSGPRRKLNFVWVPILKMNRFVWSFFVFSGTKGKRAKEAWSDGAGGVPGRVGGRGYRQIKHLLNWLRSLIAFRRFNPFGISSLNSSTERHECTRCTCFPRGYFALGFWRISYLAHMLFTAQPSVSKPEHLVVCPCCCHKP